MCHHYFGFKPGYVGVDFFFVLSGFILTYNYAGAIESWTDRRQFWWKRFARIYPTHLLTLLLALPRVDAASYGPGKLGTVIATNLLLLQSWVPSGRVYFGLNSVSWSLSVEAFFYACLPPLLAWAAQASPRSRWAVIWVWTAVLLGAGSYWATQHPDASLAADPGHFLFYINPASRLFEFAVGIALGLGFVEAPDRSCRMVHEVGAIALAAVSLLALSTELVPAPLALSVAFVPAAAAMVFVFARGGGTVTRVLCARWLVILGEASFALYMIHQLALRYFEDGFGTGLLVHVASACLCVVLSVGLWVLFERPVQRWLVRAAVQRPVPGLGVPDR